MSIKEFIAYFYNPATIELGEDAPPTDAVWKVDNHKIYHVYKDGQRYCTTIHKEHANLLAKLLKDHDGVGKHMTPEEITKERRMAAIRNLDFQLDTIKTVVLMLVGISIGKIMNFY